MKEQWKAKLNAIGLAWVGVLETLANAFGKLLDRCISSPYTFINVSVWVAIAYDLVAKGKSGVITFFANDVVVRLVEIIVKSFSEAPLVWVACMAFVLLLLIILKKVWK